MNGRKAGKESCRKADKGREKVDKPFEPDIGHNHSAQGCNEANPLLLHGQFNIFGVQNQSQAIVAKSKSNQEDSDTCNLQVKDAAKAVEDKTEKNLCESDDPDGPENRTQSTRRLGQEKCAKGGGGGLQGTKQPGANTPAADCLEDDAEARCKQSRGHELHRLISIELQGSCKERRDHEVNREE